MSVLKRVSFVLVGVLIGYTLSLTIAPIRAQRGQTPAGRFETKSSNQVVGGNTMGYYVQDTKTNACWFVILANGGSPQQGVAVSPASSVECAAK
jgi:hypothetical protein